MKDKLDQWIISISFCAFLLGMLVLYLFLPKHTFSRQEKRYLAKTPVISWESLRSEDFSEKAEAYMADHVPGRDFFVGLNAYYKLLTGRQASEEILLTWETGWSKGLFRTIPQPSRKIWKSSGNMPKRSTSRSS